MDAKHQQIYMAPILQYQQSTGRLLLADFYYHHFSYVTLIVTTMLEPCITARIRAGQRIIDSDEGGLSLPVWQPDSDNNLSLLVQPGFIGAVGEPLQRRLGQSTL